jgi:hypothetical protein
MMTRALPMKLIDAFKEAFLVHTHGTLSTMDRSVEQIDPVFLGEQIERFAAKVGKDLHAIRPNSPPVRFQCSMNDEY